MSGGLGLKPGSVEGIAIGIDSFIIPEQIKCDRPTSRDNSNERASKTPTLAKRFSTRCDPLKSIMKLPDINEDPIADLREKIMNELKAQRPVKPEDSTSKSPSTKLPKMMQLQT
jgi:hypothetical protein